jgi:50S ribosomal subunit-associated GTPase HflX
MGSVKAEATKNFVKEYPADEIQQIVVDEHLTTKQMHNLENLAELPVIDRERLILEYIFLESCYSSIKTPDTTRKNKVSFSAS